MSELTITNCHIHLFNIDHVPNGYLPLGLMRALRQPYIRTPLIWVLRQGIFWREGDVGERAARFADIGRMGSQKEIFDVVSGYYPRGTRFIVLPMDMAFMKRGKPPKEIREQHDELAELARDAEGAVIPFAAIDPRRENVLDELKRCRDKGFRGVKLYPPLGYRPDDKVLMDDIYPYCLENGLPIMSHCSRGGVRQRNLSNSEQEKLASPAAFRAVLERFPELHVCLAHFGGDQDWNDYLGPPHRRPSSGRDEFRRNNWLTQILDMLRSEQYPNLWTDISYTAFEFQQNVPVLNIFLNEKKILNRVLFGSDFYMTEIAKVSERRVSMELRHGIGDDKFRQIAHVNPDVYLNP
ncbi:MAG: amidohydrolase family protein [Pseudomonadota bacterium]